MQHTSERAQASAGAALKGAIDRGDTRDKIPGFDPGAAPLGTDDESAGTTMPGRSQPLPRQKPNTAGDLAADPAGNERTGYRHQDRAIWPAIIGLMIMIAVVVLAIWYFSR